MIGSDGGGMLRGPVDAQELARLRALLERGEHLAHRYAATDMAQARKDGRIEWHLYNRHFTPAAVLAMLAVHHELLDWYTRAQQLVQDAYTALDARHDPGIEELRAAGRAERALPYLAHMVHILSADTDCQCPSD